jgi:TonB family protein
METRSFTLLCLGIFLFSGASLSAQNVSPASAKTPDVPRSVAAPAVAVPAATAAPPVDRRSVVRAVMQQFAVNDQAVVPGLKKPLPLTGAWGVQTVFPQGAPVACRRARVACAVVLYRVPEAHVACEWVMGLTKVLEPQPKGPPVHKDVAIALDENADAARYTLRHAWLYGDDTPQRDRATAISYPTIAESARQGGVVVVSYTVDPTGKVEHVHTDYGSEILGAAVGDAVKQWHFIPQQVGSQAVWFRSRLSVDFGESEHVDITAGMDPSGKIMLDEADPHLQAGSHMESATGGAWETCNGVNCSFADPPTPK